MKICPMTINLDSARKALYDKINSFDYVESTHLMEYLPPTQSIIDGKFYMNLPKSCTKTKFAISNVEFENDSNYVMFADVVFEDTSCQTGSLMMIAKDNNVTGNIQVDDIHYQIFDIYGLHYVSVLKNQNSTNYCRSDFKTTPPTPPFPGTNPCTVKILFIHNQSALDSSVDIHSISNGIVQQCNQTAFNSQINSNLLFQSVGHVFYPFVQINQTLVDDQNPSDINDIPNLYLSDFNQLRNQSNADLIVLLTGDSYIDALGAAQAIPANSNQYFAIVRVQESLSLFVAAHELGHLMGARHEDDKVNNACAYSFKLGPLFNKHTIVTLNHNPLLKSSRILNWSNPNVYYLGKKTGQNNSNNSGAVKNNACTIANLFTEPTVNSFMTGVIGKNADCPNANVQLIAQAVGGNPPYSYEWRVSQNPLVFSGPVLSTFNAFSVTSPSVLNQYLYVELKVKDSSNPALTSISKHSVHAVKVGNCGPMKQMLIDEITNTDSTLSNEVTIFPNPVCDKLQLQIQTQELSMISVDILDEKGVIVDEIKQTLLEKGFYKLEAPISLPSGIYLVNVHLNSKITTHKILVL